MAGPAGKKGAAKPFKFTQKIGKPLISQAPSKAKRPR